MIAKSFIVVALLNILNLSSQTPVYFNDVKDCYVQRAETSPRVFLTISSLYVSTTKEGIVQRQLEINWAGGIPLSGDTIAVYDKNPFHHLKREPILSIEPHDYPGGYFRSEITIPVLLLNRSHLEQDHCLGYWVAYRNNQSEIQSSSCLRIQPFWMEENEKYLSELSLSQVMIPGSHDSGSFYYLKESGPLSKYMYAQEENIFSQMLYGLRYFDLRVGYYKDSKEKYYINHNFLKTEHSVKSVLHEVLSFIKSTKKEIVILDYHNFPIGFDNNSTHEKLMKMTVKILGSYLIPTTEEYENAPFRFLWKNNKRILISYGNDIRKRYFSHLFWPDITRAWGNKQDPEELKTYFEEFFQKKVPDGLWASMAELTPNTKTIILHPETGLRVYADMINKNVTHWFRDMYWHKTNIVATDYFLGNDIINVAIQTNRIKGLCPEMFWSKISL